MFNQYQLYLQDILGDEEWFNTAFLFSLAYLSQQPETLSQLRETLANMKKINESEIQQIENEIILLQVKKMGEI